jgi:amino acid transporter
MRRFLLVVFGGCAAASAAFALLPGQLAGYLALFEQHARVNSGAAVTVLTLAILALVALRVRLWRSERELARMRRGLAQPAYPIYPVYPVYPADPVSSWGSRPAR